MKRIEGKEGGMGEWKERRKLVRHGSRRDKQVKRAVTIAAIIMLWLCTIKPTLVPFQHKSSICYIGCASCVELQG